MKKGQIYEGTVERVDYPDKGIVRADGETAAVRYGLPGQRLRFAVTKKKRDRIDGRILEVLERGSGELSDVSCPYFGRCGGCNYLSLPEKEENRIKLGQLQRLLDPVIGEGILEEIKEPPRRREYRNKMEFSFGDEYRDGPLALGMHRRGSFYDILSVPECRIVSADFRRILSAALRYFTEAGTEFYRKNSHTGYLRHLMVRRAEATGEILVVLVTSSQTGEDMLRGAGRPEGGESEPFAGGNGEKKLLDGFVRILRELPLEGKLNGILHTVNDSPADAVRSDRTDVLYGVGYIRERLLGLEFRITPFSFFQTNSSGAEVLYETVREYIGDTGNRVIFDLYSGTGTIAQVLAPVAKHVVGVEIVEEAVEAARANAAGNGLRNCEFIAGDVLRVLDSLTERPDLIVLDPPREGIHPKALPKIIAYGVERIVYISCKPTSLARDLAAFYRAGYRVTRACGVNLFCGSANIETVCLLERTGRETGQ